MIPRVLPRGYHLQPTHCNIKPAPHLTATIMQVLESH